MLYIIDDCSRLAYSEILHDEKKDTVVGFGSKPAFFAGYGINISRMMNGISSACRSRQFNTVLAAQQFKHVLTRPYRPQSNGKVERFNRTVAAERAFVHTHNGTASRACNIRGG